MSPPAELDTTPIDVADVASTVAELGLYVVALAAIVFTALTFRYGFHAVWSALKSALRITSKSASTK